MTDDGRLYDDAPKFLKLLALLAAVAVLTFVIPRLHHSRGIGSAVSCVLFGLISVWFPHVLAHYSDSVIELPLPFVRIAGWCLIGLPLILALV